MRAFRLGISAVVLSCFVAGCTETGDNPSVAPEKANDPNAGMDALKRMGTMPTAKSVKQSETTPQK